MKVGDALKLLALAALWGASFLFMRMAAAPFGPLSLVFARLAIAGGLLLPLVWRAPNRTRLRDRAGPLLVAGLLSAAVPFSLLAYASLHLTAGFTSLINALTPVATAIVAGLFWHQRLRRTQWLGLAIGLAGVAILTWGRMSFRDGGTGWAIVAAGLATVCYGFGGNYSQRRFAKLPPILTAAGSLTSAGLALLIPGLITWPNLPPPPVAWLAVGLLGALCTTVAYLLYYHLLQRTSATQVAAVTFLVPLFAMFWGAIILGETVTPRMGLASVVILSGTALTLGLLLPRRSTPRST